MNDISVRQGNLMEIDGRKFYEGQRVSISIKSVEWRSYDGIIQFIANGYLELDCSTRNISSHETIYFKEIIRISKLR